MTAVMRAVSQETGPKILRIGVVQSGKVIDERLIKQRENVTIGPSEKAMFVVPSRKIPPNFPIFQLVNNQYHLNYLDGMTGRVALKTGVADLKQLKAQAKQDSIAGATAYKVQLGEDARGKIVVGETTFLFQFVVKPPEPPKAQLPVAVKKGFAGDIDWFTTIVASFSFLLHFMLVLMAYAYDPPVDDEYTINRLVEMGKSVPPPPPLEKPKAEAEETEDDSKAKKEEEAPKTAKAAPKSKAAPGPKSPSKGGEAAGPAAEADAKAADIASQLAALDVQTVGALNTSGPAVAGVLGEGEVPVGLLDDAGAQNSAAGTGEPGGLKGLGGKGSGSVTPGSGGKGRLSDIGNTGSGTSGSATDAGEAKKVEGPKGNAVVGGAGVAGGAVSNASSVVARMRGRFRACYQQGLNSNPNLEGQVVLTAKIGPSGQVTSVGGGGGGLGAIVGCLKAVVSSGAFSPPEGGSAVVSIPITFVKQ